ncbi:MAG: hypothetical protein PHY15_00620 [Eubacteriales bacterium]|nr:hypothetical protein [Eubacteriales bacterium]MDD4475307.1 hypothetical protein [Eubacteriales bacterium]
MEQVISNSEEVPKEFSDENSVILITLFHLSAYEETISVATGAPFERSCLTPPFGVRLRIGSYS